MNEEQLFVYTDELMMQAREDHACIVKQLEQGGYCESDILEELRIAIDSNCLDWSLIYILAVMGVSLNDN